MKSGPFLVGLVYKDQTEEKLEEYLSELAFLTETAGAYAVKHLSKITSSG